MTIDCVPSGDDTPERSLMTATQKNRITFKIGTAGTHEYHLWVFAVVLNRVGDVQLSVVGRRTEEGERWVEITLTYGMSLGFFLLTYFIP